MNIFSLQLKLNDEGIIIERNSTLSVCSAQLNSTLAHTKQTGTHLETEYPASFAAFRQLPIIVSFSSSVNSAGTIPMVRILFMNSRNPSSAICESSFIFHFAIPTAKANAMNEKKYYTNENREEMRENEGKLNEKRKAMCLLNFRCVSKFIFTEMNMQHFSRKKEIILLLN